MWQRMIKFFTYPWNVHSASSTTGIYNVNPNRLCQNEERTTHIGYDLAGLHESVVYMLRAFSGYLLL
jgi:hypothetical protein